LFVCTYSPDEPYHEVIRAAAQFEANLVVYISGKIPQKEQWLQHSIPKNVVLTGYLPEEEYVRLLHSVDVVIDLTTREDCLVCGAYESIAAERPLIVSDTKALREAFHLGTLYSNNTASDLVAQIKHATTFRETLQREMQELKTIHTKGRGEMLGAVENWLEKMECM